jgi:hypothetical protein
MRHDELLEEFDRWIRFLSDKNKGKEWVKALRAVVELHKPDESDFPDEWESCVECSGNGYVAMYPCQTIRVIEKELA